MKRIALFAALLASHGVDAAQESIHVEAFDVPKHLSYLSAETRAGLERAAVLYDGAQKRCNPATRKTSADIRACEARMYPPIIVEARKLYDVRIEQKTIAGIYTDVITPAEGVPPKTRDRVLINAHGGAFMYGARYTGQLAAMPMAAIGKYKVVAVDYRMAPDHHFPAASEDIAAVYKELLKDYKPQNIGLYGCSDGGRIAGQAVAWIADQKLPRPGAVAMLCSPPTGVGGDSNIIAAALAGRPPLTRNFNEGYFKGVSPGVPLAFPGDSDEMLAKFPPSLLMTSGPRLLLEPDDPDAFTAGAPRREGRPSHLRRVWTRWIPQHVHPGSPPRSPRDVRLL